MRKQLKKQLLELTALLAEAHDNIQENLEKKDLNTVLTVLKECQNTAIAIGSKIDEIEGEGTSAVKELEYYCELAYQIYEKILQGEDVNPRKLYKLLNKSYTNISNKIKYDIVEKKEIVFLPYMASMWDSLESVWKRASEDPKVEAIVIPIPYYDKNSDGTLGNVHYEGSQFPDYVPIIHFDDYNFKANHPDEIYIHNPYDDMNTVTSVHPFFYSRNLKQYTDKLIYIPYFVIEEFDVNNRKLLENRSHFAQVPAVLHADEVIVQSENIRRLYIESIVMLTGEDTRKQFEKKIKGTGSPKIEKIKSMSREEITIPEAWKRYLYRNNGTQKKVVLYNTSITTFLRESEQILIKIKEVFHVFNDCKDDIVLFWRPHPLIEQTIKTMRPQLWEQYKALVEYYKKEDIGIYDDTVDMDRAIVIADAYYGDTSSLVTLCKAINMPVMIQNSLIIDYAEGMN